MAKKLRTSTGRISLRGERGQTVGAPPKPVSWPTTPFTIPQLFARNSVENKGKAKGLCLLSLRNKVNDAIEAGEIVELEGIRQPGGAVGRPKSRFVLKANFDAAKMKLKAVQQTVAVAQVIPASAPAPANVPVQPAAFVAPAPAFTSAPASPASESTSDTSAAPVASEPSIG